MTPEDEFELIKENEVYDQNWQDYQRYLTSTDWDTREQWLPIVYGCMLGENLKDFFGKFDWTQKDTEIVYDDEGKEIDRYEIDGKYIEPPCGEMPDSIMLACYHAKRLAPEVKGSILPHNAKELYLERRTELLYGRDPLSVIDMLKMKLGG